MNNKVVQRITITQNHELSYLQSISVQRIVFGDIVCSMPYECNNDSGHRNDLIIYKHYA